MLQDSDSIAGYVTVRVAAQMLGVKPDTLHRRIDRETVPALRVGRTLLVKLDDVALSQPDWPHVGLTSAEK